MIIAIVMGGYSKEFTISLQSGSFILNNLNKKKYTIYSVIIMKNIWYVKNKHHQIELDKSNFSFKLNNKIIKFDAILNTIHGIPGENGQMQAYWNLLNIPFSGCNFYQSALTFNKKDTLTILSKYGFCTAPSIYLTKKTSINYHNIIKKIGTPFIIKPNQSGSSLGVSKINNKSEFNPALNLGFKQDNILIIEKYLKGKEISVGVCQYLKKITIIGITEIITNNMFFDFEAKYLGKSKEITPAHLSKKLVKKIEGLCVKAYKLLSLNGIIRIDFIIVNQIPYLLEINTNPGLSHKSIIPQQIKNIGIKFSDLLDQEIYRITQNQK